MNDSLIIITINVTPFLIVVMCVLILLSVLLGYFGLRFDSCGSGFQSKKKGTYCKKCGSIF